METNNRVHKMQDLDKIVETTFQGYRTAEQFKDMSPYDIASKLGHEEYSDLWECAVTGAWSYREEQRQAEGRN
jgi:hypothetical protein